MNAACSLIVAAELGSLAAVRDFVRESAAALGIAPRVIPSLLLAMDEAATNIVEHGYCGRPGPLEIEMYREGCDIVMRLCDQAPVFDPTTQVAPPDLTAPLEERDLGHLGVYFMLQFMDEVVHRARPEGGNELTMRKRVA